MWLSSSPCRSTCSIDAAGAARWKRTKPHSAGSGQVQTEARARKEEKASNTPASFLSPFAGVFPLPLVCICGHRSWNTTENGFLSASEQCVELQRPSQVASTRKLAVQSRACLRTLVPGQGPLCRACRQRLPVPGLSPCGTWSSYSRASAAQRIHRKHSLRSLFAAKESPQSYKAMLLDDPVDPVMWPEAAGLGCALAAGARLFRQAKRRCESFRAFLLFSPQPDA